MTGRLIYQVERLEAGMEPPPDTFTLATSATRASVAKVANPFAASGRGR